MLRKTFGSKREEVKEHENCIIRGFMNCTSHHAVKPSDQGGLYGRGIRYVSRRLRWGNTMERDHSEDVNVDRKITLTL